MHRDRAHIGPEIDQVADAQRQELAFVVDRELAFDEHVARLVVGEARFRARRHPVHGAARHLRRHQQHRQFRIGPGLEPEGAADVLGDDAQLLALEAHDRQHAVAQHAGALRAGAQRICVGLRIVAAGAAARLHGGDEDALVVMGQPRHVGGRLDDGVGLARIGVGILRESRPIERGVAARLRPQVGRAGRHRGARIDDGRLLLVLDHDLLGRILCGG